jgi:3-deoxy-D-manno-octulosonic-acid transferase
VDTIGLLTKIYSYAEIAYVGGGFETGLHNTLEPAVFGIPVIIGPRYHGFKEAEDLVALQGILSITDGDQFKSVIDRLLKDPSYRDGTGAQNIDYINANKGASRKIMALVDTFLAP